MERLSDDRLLRSCDRRIAIIVAVLAACWPGCAKAQFVRGLVIDDENGTRLPSASVALVREGERVLAVASDGNGVFMLPVRGSGTIQLEVEALGYDLSRSQPFEVEWPDTVYVEFRLRPDAVLLRPLVVTARSTSGRTRFERRRTDWGRGIFVSPAQIDSINPRFVGDVFRGMEKVWMRWAFGETASGSYAPMPEIRTFLGRGCLLYMVDRVQVRPEPWVTGNHWGAGALTSILPDDLVAVEVYRYPGEAPPELRRYTNLSRTVMTERGMSREERDLCGLVVLWTKAGW